MYSETGTYGILFVIVLFFFLHSVSLRCVCISFCLKAFNSMALKKNFPTIAKTAM